MNEQKKNRWYDDQPDLADAIEGLRDLERAQMNKILREIKKFILAEYSDLIDKTVEESPPSIERRWYDKDPLSWMTINALQYADEGLRKRVIAYIRDHSRNQRIVQKF